MRKTTFLIAMIIIEAITAINAQSFWVENDVRISEHGKATVYSQIQYTYAIKETKFSLSSYVSTNYNWHEGLIFCNYQYKIFSAGIGAGIELTNGNAGFRWSPSLTIMPQVDPNEGGRLEIVSKWEFGTQKSNYWYSNSIIYQARPDDELSGELGFIYRRFYGVGPVVGFQLQNENKLSIRLRFAILRDFEFDNISLTPILTITF